MKTNEIEAVKNILSRSGCLEAYNRDLIDDAIYCADHGMEYRAECSLKTLAANLRNDGHRDLAEHVERLY